MGRGHISKIFIFKEWEKNPFQLKFYFLCIFDSVPEDYGDLLEYLAGVDGRHPGLELVGHLLREHKISPSPRRQTDRPAHTNTHMIFLNCEVINSSMLPEKYMYNKKYVILSGHAL